MTTDDAPSPRATTQLSCLQVAYYLVTRLMAFGFMLSFLVTTGDRGFAFWSVLALASTLAALISFRLWLWYAVLRTRR